MVNYAYIVFSQPSALLELHKWATQVRCCPLTPDKFKCPPSLKQEWGCQGLLAKRAWYHGTAV